MFDVPQSFRHAEDMGTDEKKRRAADYLRRELAERGIDPADLPDIAKVDPGTVRTFLAAETWPQRPTRQKIEKALDLPAGALSLAASGTFDLPEPDGVDDAVERAIYRSALTRANQLELAGIYHHMLERQGVRGA